MTIQQLIEALTAIRDVNGADIEVRMGSKWRSHSVAEAQVVFQEANAFEPYVLIIAEAN
ncbi:hypothetical protein NKJ84_01550 [Mesorhizobium sp. M0048]|uniref:hypothetical protein n=1 Tax=Mesorhizobium sp. M0048 TaxID=2956860 RepID=UPI0033352809